MWKEKSRYRSVEENLGFREEIFKVASSQLVRSAVVGASVRTGVRISRWANIIAITLLITVCSCQGNQATGSYTSPLRFSWNSRYVIRVTLCLFSLLLVPLSEEEVGRIERLSIRAVERQDAWEREPRLIDTNQELPKWPEWPTCDFCQKFHRRENTKQLEI